MSKATLVDAQQGVGRAIRVYALSAPKAFRGLGMRASKVMVSVAPVHGDETEVAVLPLARDGYPIAYRQASISTNLRQEALLGDFDAEVLTIAGIDLTETEPLSL